MEPLSPCLLVIIVVVVAGGGVVLCENCIVDAKSFFCLISFVLFCVCFSCGAPPLNAATPVCGVGVGGVFVVRAHGGCLGMSSR